jgi:hypothetical protein
MLSTIVIAVGDKNPLTPEGIDAINKLRKLDKHKQYAFKLLYHVPNIPGICLMVETIRNIEQHHRDKAKATLRELSQKLGIALPMRNGLIDYSLLIESGSTGIIYAVRAMNVATILTSDPNKITFDIFDTVMKWVQRTQTWRHIRSTFTQRPGKLLSIMTPEQFVEQCAQLRSQVCNEMPYRDSTEEMADFENQYMPLWHKMPQTTTSFCVNDSVELNENRDMMQRK